VVLVGSDAGTSTMEVTPGPVASGEVPPGVQKLPDAAGAKANKYFCDTCNVSLNSEIQLEQVSSHHCSSMLWMVVCDFLHSS
jgi:hypothetical protein